MSSCARVFNPCSFAPVGVINLPHISAAGARSLASIVHVTVKSLTAEQAEDGTHSRRRYVLPRSKMGIRSARTDTLNTLPPAGPDEFRTAPLWGVGQRIFFLHDSRTTDLVEAIGAHSSPHSEANRVVEKF